MSNRRKQRSSHKEQHEPIVREVNDPPVAASINDIYDDLTKSTLADHVHEEKMDEEKSSDRFPQHQHSNIDVSHASHPKRSSSSGTLYHPPTYPTTSSQGGHVVRENDKERKGSGGSTGSGGDTTEITQHNITKRPSTGSTKSTTSENDPLFRSPSPQIKSIDQIKQKLNFTPSLQNTDITSTEDEADFTTKDPLFDMGSENHITPDDNGSLPVDNQILETVSSGERILQPQSQDTDDHRDYYDNTQSSSSSAFNNHDRGYEPRIITTMTSATPTMTAQGSYSGSDVTSTNDSPYIDHNIDAHSSQTGSVYDTDDQGQSKCPSNRRLSASKEPTKVIVPQHEQNDHNRHPYNNYTTQDGTTTTTTTTSATNINTKPCPRLASPLSDAVLVKNPSQDGSTNDEYIAIPVISAARPYASFSNPGIHDDYDHEHSMSIPILHDDHSIGQVQVIPQSPGEMQDIRVPSNHTAVLMALAFAVIVSVAGFLLFAFRS